MDAEQIQALIDAGFANASNATPAVLIFMGAFMLIITIIISLSLVILALNMNRVTLALLAQSNLFINAMTTRSVMANEQIRASTDQQTHAIQGQSIAMESMNQTGLATGAAVSAVSDKVSIGLEILKLLGVDVGELAKHASHPTAASKDKVDQIAGKAEQTPPAPAVIPVAASGNEIKVDLPVTLIPTDTPA